MSTIDRNKSHKGGCGFLNKVLLKKATIGNIFVT